MKNKKIYSRYHKTDAVSRTDTIYKASKKRKDDYFAAASGDLKESTDALIQVYGDGSKKLE